jgi:peroxiredoxin
LNVVLVVARLLLALVFLAAAATKLADLPGSRRAIIDFGLPSFLAAPLGLLLPLVEAAAALALIPASTALWGAVGAFTLLLLFMVGIGVNLVRGRKPECHCFGQLHSAPAGWKTLARNGALAAVAGLLVWGGWNGTLGPSAIAWLSALPIVQLVALAGGILVLGLLAGQWLFLLHLLGQNGRLLSRVEALESTVGLGGAAPAPNDSPALPVAEGLPVGATAPDFGLSGIDGKTIPFESLRASKNPLLLLFTDPNCNSCTAMLSDIGRWQAEHWDKLTLVLVSRGNPEENRAKAQEHGLTNVLLQEDWEVSEAYGVEGSPSAVLIGADGTIASPVVGGARAIGNLLAYAVGERAELPMQPADQGEPCPNCGKGHAAAPTVPAARKIGEPAPEVKLPDLEGKTVKLEDFQGEDAVVLFWNPGCGFCRQMLPDIKEWEANRPEGAPRLLVVSAGTEEANRQMDLSSTVVLDQQFVLGREFGASGTPAAVLVDAEGKVASEVAVGAPTVLELARGSRTGA